MTTTFKFLVLPVIVIVVALIAFLVIDLNSHNKAFGATTPSTFTAMYATESAGSPIFVLGNALTGPYATGSTGYNNGQFQFQGVRAALTSTATTTPCNIQNPFNATSTEQSFDYVITTGTSGASVVTLATSSVPNALTSPISSVNVAAGAQASLLVGETASSTGQGVIIPPNGWLVGGSASTVTESGYCGAVFETL